MLPKDPEECV